VTDLFEQHGVYVLVGRDQYQVLLDDRQNPSELWSTILFTVGDQITLDGGRPRYVITAIERESMGFWKCRLVEDRC
jgi:hypothetical protein